MRENCATMREDCRSDPDFCDRVSGLHISPSIQEVILLLVGCRHIPRGELNRHIRRLIRLHLHLEVVCIA
jgi:hypothetical protein